MGLSLIIVSTECGRYMMMNFHYLRGLRADFSPGP